MDDDDACDAQQQFVECHHFGDQFINVIVNNKYSYLFNIWREEFLYYSRVRKKDKKKVETNNLTKRNSQYLNFFVIICIDLGLWQF